MIIKCPICGGEVEVPDDALPGELIDHDCGITLEVVSEGGSVKLRPLEGV
ncbi:MAG: sulfonate ABC transporter, partial [Sulfolobales archaeon]